MGSEPDLRQGHDHREGPDVVVVGGGVAGLVCARDLARAGLSVVVLEAAERVGGCVARVEVAGLVLDAGAESFATRSDAVRDLLVELGLGEDVVPPTPSPAWVHRADGTSVPLPAGGLLGIPGRPWARDVRAAVGWWGALRASADRVLPGRVGLEGAARVSVADLVGRRLGRRVLDRLVRPVVAGVHSAEPELLDADVVLPGLRERARAAGSLTRAVRDLRARDGQAASGAAVAGLRGGMHRLVSALDADLADRGVDVRTGVRVLAITADDDAWTVRWSTGHVTAPRVVLATPGPALRELLAPHLPAGSSGPGPEAGGAPGADVDVELVHLVLRAPSLDATPRGTGVLVASGSAVAAKALTHATAKWAWLRDLAGPERHVVRLSYGRAGEPPAPRGDEGALTAALEDASTLLGVSVRREDVDGWARTRWTSGLPAAAPGRAAVLAAVSAATATMPGVAVTGAWVAGTGLTAVVSHARRTARATASPPPDPADAGRAGER